MRTPDFIRGYYQLLPPGETGQRVSSIRGSATPVEDCYKALRIRLLNEFFRDM